MKFRRAMRIPLFLAVSIAATSCVSRSIALPEAPRHWLSIVCLAGPHLARTVHGDAKDPETPVWVERLGERLELRWPPGFVARFAAEVEVVDHTGRVVLREGDDLDVVMAFGYVVTCPSGGSYGVLSPTEPAAG